jgi:hypothetical protein
MCMHEDASEWELIICHLHNGLDGLSEYNASIRNVYAWVYICTLYVWEWKLIICDQHNGRAGLSEFMYIISVYVFVCVYVHIVCMEVVIDHLKPPKLLLWAQ